MTIANVEKKPGGRPKGSTGNGKTANERIARAQRNFAVEQTNIEIEAQRAQLAVLKSIEQRKLQQQERVDALYAKQESKRAPQAQIDQTITLALLVALGAITFIATAVLTADGTIASAALARFAFPWMAFILFGAVEVAILAFMLMYYVKGSRIDYDGKPVKAGQWFVAMVFAAIVAVALSVYHVLDLYEFDWSNPDLYVGIAIRLVVSLLFIFVSKGLASTIFAKAIRF